MRKYTYRIMSADGSTVLYESKSRWMTREEAHPHPGFEINDPTHSGAYLEVYEVIDTPICITFKNEKGEELSLLCLTSQCNEQISFERLEGWRPVLIEAFVDVNKPLVVYRAS